MEHSHTSKSQKSDKSFILRELKTEPVRLYNPHTVREKSIKQPDYGKLFETIKKR